MHWPILVVLLLLSLAWAQNSSVATSSSNLSISNALNDTDDSSNATSRIAVAGNRNKDLRMLFDLKIIHCPHWNETSSGSSIGAQILKSVNRKHEMAVVLLRATSDVAQFCNSDDTFVPREPCKEKVCGDHGKCQVLDKDLPIKRYQCLCDHGYGGLHCGDEVSNKLWLTAVFWVIIIIELAFLALAIARFMARRNLKPKHERLRFVDVLRKKYDLEKEHRRLMRQNALNQNNTLGRSNNNNQTINSGSGSNSNASTGVGASTAAPTSNANKNSNQSTTESNINSTKTARLPDVSEGNTVATNNTGSNTTAVANPNPSNENASNPNEAANNTNKVGAVVNK